MNGLSFYRGKKVFVTGHTGFKGSWLCHVLLTAGAKVTGYALEPPPLSLYNQIGLGQHVNSIYGDIRDKDKLLQSVKNSGPEILFHLAAQPLVRLSYREPELTYGTNVMGTVNILESLRFTPQVRSFVNVTTDKVYENKEWFWAYREDGNLCGFDPYSNSKSCSELVTSCYVNSFFNQDGSPAISTARSGNVIGGGDYSEDRIIPDCVRAAQAGMDIVIRNPDSTRPYQHVLDTLYGYLLLAGKQSGSKKTGGAYNFGPDEDSCVSTGELVKLFCGAWGGNVSWKTQSGSGPREAHFLKLDCSKAKSVLGWKPRWKIKDAVEKTVEFARLKTGNDMTACINSQIKEYFA